MQKVIQLLDDLKGKVEADLDRETKLMEEYTTWSRGRGLLSSLVFAEKSMSFIEKS